MAISILYPHRKFWRSLYGTNFLEISNGRKTVRMAPILTIFGPNESQRCQLNFEKNLGRRKNFRQGKKFEKLSRKVRKILARTRFLVRNKIETAIWPNRPQPVSDPRTRSRTGFFGGSRQTDRPTRRVLSGFVAGIIKFYLDKTLYSNSACWFSWSSLLCFC